MKFRSLHLIRLSFAFCYIMVAGLSHAQIAPPPVPPPTELKPDVTPDPKGSDADASAGENKPAKDWYQTNLIIEMKAMEDAAYELSQWSYQLYGGDYTNKREYYEMYYFADWLYKYLSNYRAKTYYMESGSAWVTERYWDGWKWATRSYQLNYDWKTPRWFNDFGSYATRGDHNNFHYNYARPVYQWVLQNSVKVKNRYSYENNSQYWQLVNTFISQYKRYTKANYGRSDTEAYITKAEDDALGKTSAALPSRSSSIALTEDDTRLVVVNRQKNSITLIQVKDNSGNDSYQTIGEIAVGREPRYVALSPDSKRAYVSNSLDGTVSVVDIESYPKLVGQAIKVGTEPRGIAVSPNGQYILVANHTDASVSIIDANSYQVIKRIQVGGNPQSIAISNNGDSNDLDEQVFVTRFYSELIDPINKPDGFNNSKRGIVDNFTLTSALSNSPKLSQYILSPIANSGFAADRRQFCNKTRTLLQDQGTTVFFNSGLDGKGNGAGGLANEAFCPDINSQDVSAEGPIGNNIQGAYPNQLFSLILRGNKIIVPNIGASPEPPVKFNSNVQALVSNIDKDSKKEFVTNLNNQIKTETQPLPPMPSLARLFGNDIVAVDADAAGQKYLFVSRGGNYVLRADLGSDGTFSINAPNNVVRFKTGNIPSGVVMSKNGSRAYTNNEVNTSVTVIDLRNNKVLQQDLNSSTPPKAGTQAHRNLVGKLAFFTALGIPDVLSKTGGSQFDIELRDINPLQFRGKASDNGWSACSSCHDDGHSDNVTWIFPTGPRQTLPLEATFAKGNSKDQRILNWNAVQGSITDFNNNSRGVQGGIGHATQVGGVNRTALIFNHGPTKGISDALDAMTEWVANAVRAQKMPKNQDQNTIWNGQQVFTDNCASCHGGAKWTKSTIANYQNNPTFEADPLGANFFAQGNEPPKDPNLLVAGPQIKGLKNNGNTFNFLDDVGTFKATNRVELRGAGTLGGGKITVKADKNEGTEVASQSTQGFAALGGIGFNSPSLLNVAYNAPYFHDGSANSLKDVFARHRLPKSSGKTIQELLNTGTDLRDLEIFLQTIDDDTKPIL